MFGLGADPYAFTDASGGVVATYADPAAEFGAPGWNYTDPSGNVLATYADPYAEFGWGRAAPVWAGFDSPRSFMYGLGSGSGVVDFITSPKGIALGVLGIFLLSRSRKSHLLPKFLRNPPKRRRRHARSK